MVTKKRLFIMALVLLMVVGTLSAGPVTRGGYGMNAITADEIERPLPRWQTLDAEALAAADLDVEAFQTMMLQQRQMNAMPQQRQMNNAMPQQRQMNAMLQQHQMNAMPQQRQMNAMPQQRQMNAMPQQRQMNAMPQQRQMNAMPQQHPRFYGPR